MVYQFGDDPIATETSLGMILEGGDNSWGSLFPLVEQHHLHGNSATGRFQWHFPKKKTSGSPSQHHWEKSRQAKCCDLFGMVFCDPLQGFLVNFSDQGSKGHGLNHLVVEQNYATRTSNKS